MFTRFSASLQVRKSTLDLTDNSSLLHFFMKGAFQLASSIIFFILLGLCTTELNWNYHHGILGPKIRSDNYRISGKFRNPDGGRRQRHQFFRIFNHGLLIGQFRESSSQASSYQLRSRKEQQSNNHSEWPSSWPCARTSKGRPRSFCDTNGCNSLAARITNSKCHVNQHSAKSNGKWNFEWKTDYSTTGFSYTTVAVVMQQHLRKTSEIYTTYPENNCDSCVTKCPPIYMYINRSITDGRSDFFCRKDLYLQSQYQVHGTIQVSQSHSKYEKCAIRTAYKLHRPILRTFICYQASSLLSVSAVWSSSCCMFSKAGTLQYVQWTSSCAAVYRQNPELRISEIKMCKLWRGTFCKQQSMQCSPRKNAAKNEPCICKITYNYHETAATICYIGRIPTCVTSNTRNTSDTRKRTLTGTATGATTSYSEAAKHHVPRSVVLAARLTSKTGALSHGSKDNSAEHPSPKQGSEQKSAEHQPITIDHRRKRGAAHALEPNTVSKKSTVSETTASRSTTSEMVPETCISENTTNQLPSPAETYDKIFAILMSQMKQLRPLFMIQDLGTKNIVRKMVKSIRELLDDLVELQSN